MPSSELPLSPKIFRANDIRGTVGVTLDASVIRQIGRALAAAAAARGADTIALGRDGRLSSEEFAEACKAGLLESGMTVVDIGMVPTPVLYYAAETHTGGCGVMITGSHNPKNDNGMKMMLNGETLKKDGVTELYRRIRENDLLPPAGGETVRPLSVDAEYIGKVAAANPLTRPLTVVLDAGNGATGNIAPALFSALGCRVIPLFCEVDGHFPNHHPDPTQPENLRDAAQSLAEHDADIALLFDGDGDRLGVIDPRQPPPFYADRLLMLYARDLLSRHSGARVVFDVKCSAHLAPWIEKHGGVADMQPTGHAFIKARMKETGALLGGEMSGHFFFRENWPGFDDGLFAAARLAAILSHSPESLASIPASIATPELHVPMGDRSPHDFVERLAKTASPAAAKRVVTIDGLRVEYENGFGLVRASNTTPALVLRFEGGDDATLAAIQADFRNWLLALDSDLSLSFGT